MAEPIARSDDPFDDLLSSFDEDLAKRGKPTMMRLGGPAAVAGHRPPEEPPSRSQWIDNLPRAREARPEEGMPESPWMPVTPDFNQPDRSFRGESPDDGWSGYPHPTIDGRDPQFRQAIGARGVEEGQPLTGGAAVDPGPDEIYTTSDIRARMPRDNVVTRALRSARDAIPANPDASVSLLNMARGGLNSAANWLDRRPEIGPDTLAPLGLAVAGTLPGMVRGAARTAETALQQAQQSAARREPLLADKERLYAEEHWGIRPRGLTDDPARAQRFWDANADFHNDHNIRNQEPAPQLTPTVKEQLYALGQPNQFAHDARFPSSDAAALAERYWAAKDDFAAMGDKAPRGYRLNADPSRASLPGVVVNGLEPQEQDILSALLDHYGVPRR